MTIASSGGVSLRGGAVRHLRAREPAGETRWLEATYFPVKHQGRVTRVLKIASDVTEQHQRLGRLEALTEALDRSQAMIEFTPNGDILHANANFPERHGLHPGEIAGGHHRIFCDETFLREQPRFWESWPGASSNPASSCATTAGAGRLAGGDLQPHPGW